MIEANQPAFPKDQVLTADGAVIDYGSFGITYRQWMCGQVARMPSNGWDDENVKEIIEFVDAIILKEAQARKKISDE